MLFFLKEFWLPTFGRSYNSLNNFNVCGVLYICCSYFFVSGNFFSFVSTSLAYIIIPKNKRKTKITWDKKLTTTYIFRNLSTKPLRDLVYGRRRKRRSLMPIFVLGLREDVKGDKARLHEGYRKVCMSLYNKFNFKIILTNVSERN